MIFDHVGVVVRRIADARARYEALLGFSAQSDVILDPVQKVFVQFLANRRGERVELIEPVDASSPSYHALKKGGGANHIAYRCPDIACALEQSRKQNGIIVCPPVPSVGFDGRLIAFVAHPDLGLTEFVEYKDED